MSVQSVLETIGGDVKKVFAFLGSPKGQAIVTAGEGLVEDVDPALTGVFNIANNWLTEIFKTQALATAAGVTPGESSEQKAAAAIAAAGPQLIAYCAQNGLPAPTASTLKLANDGLVQFLNAIGAPSTAAPAA